MTTSIGVSSSSSASTSERGREEPALARARRVAAALFGPARERQFAIRYWTGVEEPAGRPPSQFTIVVQRAGALRRMCAPPSELALGEAFVRGDFDIEGSLEAAAAIGDQVAARLDSWLAAARLIWAASRLPDDEPSRLDWLLPSPRRAGRRHSRSRDAAAVQAHYDLGNEFYALWLDPSLSYSCAYFETGTEDLQTAQVQKLDHVCRKLRLAPGERLLDVGCGWGALVCHAAQHYGVDAVGITLSARQADVARARIRAAGLEARCRIVVSDYRALQSTPFDKIVSVGMVEHVGRANLGTYYGRLFDLLTPGGVLLDHGIVSMPTASRDGWRGRLLWRQGAFFERYVFPDGELTPLADRIRESEAAGFEVRDVETLREHYALTLRHWLGRLDAARADAESLVGAPRYRAWRLYLAASAHAFACGNLSIAQVVSGRRDDHGHVPLPLTRRDLYHASE